MLVLRFSIVFCYMLASTLLAAQTRPRKTPADSMYATNLLKNPGAEADNTDNRIPHWQPIPALESWGFMNDSYGHTGGEWESGCDVKCGLPPNAGTSYFRLPATDSDTLYGLTQEIDLSAIADTLATRQVGFMFSAYMTGFYCEQPDCAQALLSIRFYDRSGQELNSFDYKQDNHNFVQADSTDERMRKFKAGGVLQQIPPGTVKARVLMQAHNWSGCCNTSYVFLDNLSLMLKKGQKR